VEYQIGNTIHMTSTVACCGRKERKNKSMKMKSMLTIVAVTIFLLSACSPKATPTPDVQATAQSAASTMLAMTQEAMPTDTPIPPTEAPTDTPQPTPTIPALPTNPPILPSPTAIPPISGGGACDGLIKASKGEELANIVIINQTKVLLGISIYLKSNSFGDCGYWYAPAGVSPSSSITITSLPASNSCYHVNAYTLSGKPNFWNTADFCASSTAKYVLHVTTASITGP
jgi:hypothetical protein